MSSQYFTEHPAAAHRPGVVNVVLPDLHLALETDAGVFSPGRLDPGTRLLLETAPPPPAGGNLLDLGCGYGPLALALAIRAPRAAVWATDVNRRALELCSRNSAAAQLATVRCLPPADPAMPASFELIWSNPPIRIGKTALHDMLAAWLSRLAPGAAAFLVVQRNLGSDSLQRWLAQAGWDAERVAARSGYRVLRVSGHGTGGACPGGAAAGGAAAGGAAPGGAAGPGAGTGGAIPGGASPGTGRGDDPGLGPA